MLCARLVDPGTPRCGPDLGHVWPGEGAMKVEIAKPVPGDRAVIFG